MPSTTPAAAPKKLNPNMQKAPSQLSDHWNWSVIKTFTAAFWGGGLDDGTTSYARTERQTATYNPWFGWLKSVAITVQEEACSNLLGAGGTIKSDKIPILFIHGYTPGDNFGGGSGTWGEFPELLKTDLGSEYAFYEFSYKSNARFQDVALDLKEAVDLLSSSSGKEVHIVAHSFGGVLARTYLQGLATAVINDIDLPLDYSTPVASLVTVGTPHSGIFDEDNEEAHGVTFPNGQDSLMHEGSPTTT